MAIFISGPQRSFRKRRSDFSTVLCRKTLLLITSGLVLAGSSFPAICAPALTQEISDAPTPSLRMPPPDPARIFAPLAYPTPENAFRTGSGSPGPLAWQNRADYKIDTSIDTQNNTLTGSETITYTNNSPNALEVLWLQLDQNIYREDARSSFSSPERHGHHTDGMVIESVAVESDGHSTTIKPLISDTRMQAALPSPLSGKGGKIQIRISWHYTIPGTWGGRTAVTPSKNGNIYEIAQFYPRMAVYDDVRGWDTAPYLGQEFYLDYGDFDYNVSVPADFIVVGSGALINPSDVLSKEEQTRLEQAGKSDERVMIRTRAEIEAAHPDNPPITRKTWRFHMTNTRDVAFVASHALLWDAARLDLPPISPAPGKPPAPRLAMSVYPVEGIDSHGWDRSTSYVRHAIEYFSKQWYPYPWPNAINVGGHGAGMEYPGLVLDGMNDRDPELFWITTHELGHDWFPMIVGSNERRHAFMDEGFNTFIDAMASDHFNHGEFAPKHDGEYAPDTGRPAEDILKVLNDPSAPILMAPSDTVAERWRHPVSYFKSAYGLTLLREQILGPERFDRAFRRYISLWAFRHPTPSDFFRLMDSEAGEDLSWFWRGWYFNNWGPDYALTHVDCLPDTQTQGAQITIQNKGWLPIPVTLQVTWADNSTSRIRIPSESWMLKQTLTLNIPGNQLVKSAELDPDHVIPDTNRSDNVMEIQSCQKAGKQPNPTH